MKELKQMIINDLLSDYGVKAATIQVNEAEIIIKENDITVIWSNGKSNNYKIETVERLVFVD